MSNETGITFKEALEKLNISDFENRIWHSNSRGELFHLADYIHLAEVVSNGKSFRTWFLIIVESAQEKWRRPESVFQHIWQIFIDHWERADRREK